MFLSILSLFRCHDSQQRITHAFQLSVVERLFRSTPSPRSSSGQNVGSPVAGADASGLEHKENQEIDDDVVAIAALSNAAANNNDDASGSESFSGEENSNEDSVALSPDADFSAAAIPHDDDVQRLLLQVNPRFVSFRCIIPAIAAPTPLMSQEDVDAACKILISRGEIWRALHVYMSHDRFPQAASLQSSAGLAPSPPPPPLCPDLSMHAAAALELNMHALATLIYASLGRWRELYSLLCKRKSWALAAALARDYDDSLKPTATTLPSLTVLQGSPWSVS